MNRSLFCYCFTTFLNYSFGIFLNSYIKKITATANEIKSVTGVAYIIPSTPINIGNIINKGSNTNICFINDIITPFTAFPIDGKNVEPTICIPLININIRNTLIYFTANLKYSSLPEPNKDIICAGKV